MQIPRAQSHNTLCKFVPARNQYVNSNNAIVSFLLITIPGSIILGVSLNLLKSFSLAFIKWHSLRRSCTVWKSLLARKWHLISCDTFMIIRLLSMETSIFHVQQKSVAINVSRVLVHSVWIWMHPLYALPLGCHTHPLFFVYIVVL